MTDSQVQGGASLDVAEYIDQQPVGAFHIKLLLTCAAVLLLDGFDTTAIGFVAPSLAREWGLTKAALGPVFSAGLFGLMIGALMLRTAGGSHRAQEDHRLFDAGVRYRHPGHRVRPRRQRAPGDPVSDRARSRRRHAEYHCHDFRVQPAAPARHHGDDHVLRLFARRRRRRPARGGADPAFRLALGVRGRRRRAIIAGADPGAAAAGIRCASWR